LLQSSQIFVGREVEKSFKVQSTEILIPQFMFKEDITVLCTLNSVVVISSANIEVLCTYLMLPMGVFRLPESQASKKQLLKPCLKF